MPTRFKLPVDAVFKNILVADRKRLYVAAIDGVMELAVGFTVGEMRTGYEGTGLLYLTGDSFGKIALFLPASDTPNFGVNAHALDHDWDSVVVDSWTEGPTHPALRSAGILRNRENVDVMVKDGGNGLQPLFVDLRILSLHHSGEDYERGLTFAGIRHEVLLPRDQLLPAHP